MDDKRGISHQANMEIPLMSYRSHVKLTHSYFPHLDNLELNLFHYARMIDRALNVSSFQSEREP